MDSLGKILFLFSCVAFWQFSVAQNIEENNTRENKVYETLSPADKINTFLQFSDSLFTSYPDQSLKYAQKALQLSEAQNYEKGKLLAFIRIADIYWEKTDLKKCLDFADRARKLAIELNDQKEYAETILIIAKAYTDLGEYDRSSEMNFEALKIFEKENDKVGLGKALNRIGYIYFEQENFDKALEYYSQSLEIAREINDLVGTSRGLNNVAAVYGNKGEFANFEAYIREAVEINKQIGRKLWEGINYLNLGVINRDSKDYDTAYFYYVKAADIFTELNNIPKLVSVNIGLSKYFTETNEQEKSLYHAMFAYELSQKNKLKKSIFESAKRLHEIYMEQDDLTNAYKFSSIEYQMKDSLDIEKSLTRLSQLELLYEFEKLNKEKELQQQRKDYTYILVGTSLLFILLVTIILLVARQRIKAKNTIIEKKQLENELEMRNKELTSNVMALMKKNEILSEIADKLMDIRDEAVKDETKSAIKRIAGELQKTTDDEIWDEFEVRFKQVHSDFYDKLIQQFPNLSPNEQRLCAFLRLNMTTKEISELTGQRTGTLEIARSRLRKKLLITNTQVNLVTFLSQI